MKQETGNNLSEPAKIVSIRLVSGGHSFSVDTLPKRAFDDDATVEFSVSTHKCLLVPAEVFDAAEAEKYLAAEGIYCAGDERAAYRIEGDKAAVMAVNAACLGQISAQFGGRAYITTPLLREYKAAGRELHIHTVGEVSYFKLYDGARLQYAEAAATADSDEILYYTTLISRAADLTAYIIYISGDNAQKTAKLLKRYFKKVQCE